MSHGKIADTFDKVFGITLTRGNEENARFAKKYTWPATPFRGSCS